MIEQTSLRIGNYVSNIFASKAEMWRVDELMNDYCKYSKHGSTYSNLRPVELTERLLLQLGFFGVNEDGLYQHGYDEENENFTLQERYLAKDGYDLYWKGEAMYIIVSSLHHLQNLYYFFMQKELVNK